MSFVKTPSAVFPGISIRQESYSAIVNNAGDVLSFTNTGYPLFANGDFVFLTSLTGGSGLVEGKMYKVMSATTGAGFYGIYTCQLSLVTGVPAAITITSDGTCYANRPPALCFNTYDVNSKTDSTSAMMFYNANQMLAAAAAEATGDWRVIMMNTIVEMVNYLQAYTGTAATYLRADDETYLQGTSGILTKAIRAEFDSSLSSIVTLPTEP